MTGKFIVKIEKYLKKKEENSNEKFNLYQLLFKGKIKKKWREIRFQNHRENKRRKAIKRPEPGSENDRKNDATSLHVLPTPQKSGANSTGSYAGINSKFPSHLVSP